MNKNLLKKELQQCYSDQAEHFSNTRKKKRPEIDFITTFLKKNNDTPNPIILEL
jgi:hypothetical protein